MESLWRTPVFNDTTKQLLSFEESDPADGRGPKCTVVQTDSSRTGETWLEDTECKILRAWTNWFEREAFEIGNALSGYATVLVPRAKPPGTATDGDPNEGPKDHMAILQEFPFTKASFNLIANKLCLHRALAILMQRGAPIMTRIPAKFNGIKSHVYILRVQHTLQSHMALSITHIPGQSLDDVRPPLVRRGPKTYAMILGCSPSDTIDIVDSLKYFRATTRTNGIFSAFTTIKIFLELERERRFEEVDDNTQSFERVIENYGIDPGSQSPEDMIDLYLEVCHLKNGLAAWRAQLVAFKEKYARDFKAPVDSDGEDGEYGEDIGPEEYLQALVDEYEIKIAKCEMVLQGASLTFQMETAHLSRQDAHLARLDTRNAIRDGKQMKAIALLTMIFLPGTFIATVLAVPDTGDALLGGFPKWQWYLILFLPLTVVVVGFYLLWVNLYKPKEYEDPILTGMA